MSTFRNEKEQDKRWVLRCLLNDHLRNEYRNAENTTDITAFFIELLSQNAGITQQEIIENVYQSVCLGNRNSTNKYKKKSKDTEKNVCHLLDKHLNYSEIAKKLDIDRRTVSKIAHRNGYVHTEDI